jgi:TolB-like protein
MTIWTSEIKELEKLYESFKGHFPELEKELGHLIRTEDENVVMLYSRRCLEVIITDLCECELKRPRKTEPLKGIVDKLNKEEKVPSHIITSMHGLNSLSTYGAHPKDFDPEQVKPVLNNLATIIKWYLKNKNFQSDGNEKSERLKFESKRPDFPSVEKSIIVLPFENMSSDPDQEYFSDGLTEEIITDLSYIDDLLVISRSSAMTFKRTAKTIPEIARSVNVRYVLEGSVRKAGNNLRITAQLIDGTNDSHIWAEKYTGTIEDVFDIQEKVSRSIADTLKIRLNAVAEKKIMTKLTDNVQFHEYYLKAKYEINQWTEESLSRAVHIIENGLKIFGENALLYATLGEAKFIYYDMGIDISDKILNEVEGYANKALSLEPGIAQGYKLYGYLEQGRGSLIASYNHIKNAYKADPFDPGILMYFALSPNVYLGKPSLTKLLDNKLLNIDPLTAANYVVVGLSEYFQGNFKSAVQILRKSFQIDPEFFLSNFWMPTFLAANNKKNEAVEYADKIIKDDHMPKAFKELNLFIKYVAMGKKAAALETLSDETKKYTWKDPLFSGLMPGYYSLIDEKEEALKYLNHAINRDFINYPFFSKIDPFLKNLRKEERFKKLMDRVKYKWENFSV